MMLRAFEARSYGTLQFLLPSGNSETTRLCGLTYQWMRCHMEELRGDPLDRQHQLPDIEWGQPGPSSLS